MLAEAYNTAKTAVIAAGYARDIDWQASRCFANVSKVDFMADLAWVIFCSGFRVEVIDRKWPVLTRIFYGWRPVAIIEHAATCEDLALAQFGSRSKVKAVIAGAKRIEDEGYDALKKRVAADPLNVLQEFDYIGPVTVYHLAKNMGLDYAKPDRHLVRMAQAAGYDDVQQFCRGISDAAGDPVPVVDLVLWRYATLDRKYTKLFRK